MRQIERAIRKSLGKPVRKSYSVDTSDVDYLLSYIDRTLTGRKAYARDDMVDEVRTRINYEIMEFESKLGHICDDYIRECDSVKAQDHVYSEAVLEGYADRWCDLAKEWIRSNISPGIEFYDNEYDLPEKASDFDNARWDRYYVSQFGCTSDPAVMDEVRLAYECGGGEIEKESPDEEFGRAIQVFPSVGDARTHLSYYGTGGEIFLTLTMYVPAPPVH